MWRSNQRAWVTQDLFKECLFKVCAPRERESIKDYIYTNDLPVKALLLLDNTPGHLKDLKVNLLTDFSWLSVQFLPPNTTSLIQPMDQEAIAAFKKLYTHALFQHPETQRNVSPSEQEEDERGPMPTSAIKDLLKKGEDVRAMVLEWHPYQADVSRVRDPYNNAINYFRKILKKREKQSTLDMFFNAP
ncbi:uncharacterized protein TNCV_328161 [Trichonephila clavipes]|nr:uncharacterized protein TNCV_328161 [Trichonephila clavipes]